MDFASPPTMSRLLQSHPSTFSHSLSRLPIPSLPSTHPHSPLFQHPRYFHSCQHYYAKRSGPKIFTPQKRTPAPRDKPILSAALPGINNAATIDPANQKAFSVQTEADRKAQFAEDHVEYTDNRQYELLKLIFPPKFEKDLESATFRDRIRVGMPFKNRFEKWGKLRRSASIALGITKENPLERERESNRQIERAVKGLRHWNLAQEYMSLERVKMRRERWVALIFLLVTTCMGTAAFMGIKMAYQDTAHDIRDSEFFLDAIKHRWVGELSHNPYNWAILVKDGHIGRLVHALEEGTPESYEWFEVIHALYALLGGWRAKQRPIITEQFVKEADPLNLLYCMKDPVLLKESHLFPDAERCSEELASVIYAVYIENDYPVKMSDEMDKLIVEYIEHGSVLHMKLGCAFLRKCAAERPRLQEYINSVDIKRKFKRLPDEMHVIRAMRDFVMAKKSYTDVSNSDIPWELREDSRFMKNYFKVAYWTKGPFVRESIEALLVAVGVGITFWVTRLRNKHLSLHKSGYLSFCGAAVPVTCALTLHFTRMGLERAEENFFGKKERSKGITQAICVARWSLLFFISLFCTVLAPDSVLQIPAMLMLPYHFNKVHFSFYGFSLLRRRGYIDDPMFLNKRHKTL